MTASKLASHLASHNYKMTSSLLASHLASQNHKMVSSLLDYRLAAITVNQVQLLNGLDDSIISLEYGMSHLAEENSTSNQTRAPHEYLGAPTNKTSG